MRIRPLFPILAFPILAAGVLLAPPEPVYAQLGSRSHRSSFYYSSPSNVLRGQLALQRAGFLEEGIYQPGRYDPPTREAIRHFQHHHRLWSSGRFDRDTFAVLPVDDRPDRDDDGIPDADDRCPETKKKARAGLDGCPLPDAEKTSSPAEPDAARD